ncbi:S-locus glycoprotein domain [Dillenia turbinata]|uniref:non-specific serine/threonine protein kinase n=1 Tax=Dillenia turbinata TaxID=194707 RepID=A0AAN8VSB3_9MAGN
MKEGRLGQRKMKSLILVLFLRLCFSLDTINPDRKFRDGDVLLSKNGTFALGFFSPGISSKRYVGVWYNKASERKVVWIANRDNPINNSFGVLSINQKGNLVLYDEKSNFLAWSTDTSSKTRSYAQLLDSGNLVLMEKTSKYVTWQSFDYPTNTLLPGMKVGLDHKTGLNRFLTSWRSNDDPGSGYHSFKLDLSGSPQLFVYRGLARLMRFAPWPWPLIFPPSNDIISRYTNKFLMSKDEICFSYVVEDPSLVMHFWINEFGSIQWLTLNNEDGRWYVIWSAPREPCQGYGHCGTFSTCEQSATQFECTCLPGYEPKSTSKWYLRDGSVGCTRKRNVSMCRNREGFLKVGPVKLPDVSRARVELNTSSADCELKCLTNCSCSAYAVTDAGDQRVVCFLWHGELMDMRPYPPIGSILYLRVDSIDLESEKKERSFIAKNKRVVIPISSAAVVFALVVIVISLRIIKRRNLKGEPKQNLQGLYHRVTNSTSRLYKDPLVVNGQKVGSSSPTLALYNFSTLVAATNNFASENMVGRGGFGSVYKGQLTNGVEIAIKRLSKGSAQGVEEFKNEVMLIAQLQHKNLVKLLGCCTQQEEKIMVYEYLPNKSLDNFIFDQQRKTHLDWRKRFKIIIGIARGMMYLHKDSRLKIIHRDLKASNVLLDDTMNPKISDFGMARIFEDNQSQAMTKRVVGTYGYMSPEYVLFGKFSTKSDTFSFGVLLLEIISSKRNNVDYKEHPSLNLIGHVWDLWREDKALEIVDCSMAEPLFWLEAFKCIQVGLLCVQELATDRPAMSDVVSMLESNTNQLPSPKQPGFLLARTGNTIYPNQFLRDGDVLLSKNETFALGFFTPNNSSNRRYVGVWYNKVIKKNAVWVANRENPINNTFGVLSIDQQGNLLLCDVSRSTLVWSANVSSKSSHIQLLDSGNLVLVEENSNLYVWQSFDHPTDTVLPGMKIGLDRKTDHNLVLTSWRSHDDPGQGDYMLALDLSGSPQFFLCKGSTRLWRTAPWPWRVPILFLQGNSVRYYFTNNKDGVLYSYNSDDSSVAMRLVVQESGYIFWYMWNERVNQWNSIWSFPKDICDEYRHCGAYSICAPDATILFECSCLPGFEPKSPGDWHLRDGLGGCVRKENISMCGNGEGFLKVARMKLPDTSLVEATKYVNSLECQQQCLRNCSCTAYATALGDEKENVCLMWFGELIDMRPKPEWGIDLFLRVDSITLAENAKQKKGFLSKKELLVISFSIDGVLLTLFLVVVIRRKKLKANRQKHRSLDHITTSKLRNSKENSGATGPQESSVHPNVPFYDFTTIIAATNNFTSTNKLGHGGFGSVYKGQLPSGVEIAVKRLLKDSGQGSEEFKNEVMLMAQLQHKNLVKLFGYCIERDEKILVYEYLPNKSLDNFIFDEKRKSELNWRKRYEIIVGIAKGLVYLHQDSRLTIIHRDLKASNVLLDNKLNPKISDFGIAKICGGEHNQANTRRIVGTYGYMSPEYEIFGNFSTKSDVFSFGVLLLEIISGKRNNVDYQNHPSLNLIGFVWELWKQDKALEIIDSSLEESDFSYEALRCIQVGLLCVQECAADRPAMSEVVFMLGNNTSMPSPMKPAFVLGRSSNNLGKTMNRLGEPCSVNEVSITIIEAR